MRRCYSVSGSATGPYFGTFTEAGSASNRTSPLTLNATFTIDSATSTVNVTGSKTFGHAEPALLSCSLSSSVIALVGASYTATIHTPKRNFHDEGLTNVGVQISTEAATLTETFTSSLDQPELISPTSMDQCKHGGWMNYPQFKNQGDCVSFVASSGNQPSG